jgi:hypothetical protein
VRVRDHVLISTAGAALSAPLIGRRALNLWAGGVLIDIDHYVWFCVQQRRLNPLTAVHFFNQADPPQHSATRALHSPAALVAILLLGLRHRGLLPLVLGMGLHVALDVRHRERMDQARSAALERDGHSCQVCGTVTPPIGIHTACQPWLLPSYSAGNLVSLCGRCHKAAHAPRHLHIMRRHRAKRGRLHRQQHRVRAHVHPQVASLASRGKDPGRWHA